MEPPKLGITISDYLFYPGEGSENCINNTKELFVWEISGDNIEDDVEIVASPRDTRGTPLPAPAAAGPTQAHATGGGCGRLRHGDHRYGPRPIQSGVQGGQ